MWKIGRLRHRVARMHTLLVLFCFFSDIEDTLVLLKGSYHLPKTLINRAFQLDKPIHRKSGIFIDLNSCLWSLCIQFGNLHHHVVYKSGMIFLKTNIVSSKPRHLQYTDISSSIPTLLNYWVKWFVSRLLGCESPIDGFFSFVAPFLPSCHPADQRLLIPVSDGQGIVSKARWFRSWRYSAKSHVSAYSASQFVAQCAAASSGS